MTELTIEQSTIEVALAVMATVQALFLAYGFERGASTPAILFLFAVGTLFGFIAAIMSLTLLPQWGLV